MSAFPPVVFVAGKFRAPTAWEMTENAREALRWSLKVAECGAIPLCPHANMGHFHGLLTEQFWIDASLALLAKSDAAVFIPNWVDSEGATGEHAYCKREGTPRFGSAHVIDGTFAQWVRCWKP